MLTPDEKRRLGEIVRQQIVASIKEEVDDIHLSYEILNWRREFEENLGEVLFLYGYAQGACHRRILRWIKNNFMRLRNTFTKS